MSLILRTQLPRPLTHEELDGNFKFVYVKPWEYGDYRTNMLVYIKEQEFNLIFRCIVPHVRYVYNSNKEFSRTAIINGVNTILWEQITYAPGGSVTSIQSLTINGTIATITMVDGSSFSTDVNDLYLSGEQFAKGITTHGFEYITESDFTTTLFQTKFPHTPQTISETIEYRKLSFEELTAKETTVLINIGGNPTNRFVLELPSVNDFNSVTQKGKRLRLFMKYNTIVEPKNFVVGTKWISTGLENKIISTSNNTKMEGVGYFLTLEEMEVIDLFWDGNDWIALTMNKLDYVQKDPISFITDVADYVIRSVD